MALETGYFKRLEKQQKELESKKWIKANMRKPSLRMISILAAATVASCENNYPMLKSDQKFIGKSSKVKR